MTGLVTAIYDIGCALGAVAAFVWGERIGRKWSIVWANVVVIIAAVIQCTSFEYWQMFVARIIGGLGVGLSTVSFQPPKVTDNPKVEAFLHLGGRSDPPVRNPTSAQPGSAVSYPVRSHHPRRCSRLLALLRDIVRGQFDAVALPCCLPDLLLPPLPCVLSFCPRDTKVACKTR